ncbi:MAG: DUF4164 family protein [Alphaproteobacteria bacterium]|nr:DUF4164 family protein [Alphaproteobacteria bacterium]
MLDSLTLDMDDLPSGEPGPVMRARRRLETAFSTLVLAVEALREQAGPPIDLKQEVVDGFQREISALRDENERLNALLTESEQQYEAIKAVTRTVSTRLNDSVGRLQTILEDDHA